MYTKGSVRVIWHKDMTSKEMKTDHRENEWQNHQQKYLEREKNNKNIAMQRKCDKSLS